jgi:hypothetical protein
LSADGGGATLWGISVAKEDEEYEGHEDVVSQVAYAYAKTLWLRRVKAEVDLMQIVEEGYTLRHCHIPGSLVLDFISTADWVVSG